MDTLLRRVVRTTAFILPLFFIMGVTPAAGATPAYFVQGAYGSDASATGYDYIEAAQVNTVEVYPDRGLLDEVQQAGMRAFIWLGGWSNDTCRFDYDDNKVRALVTRVAGHPALAFYYIGDEPSAGYCPRGPAAFRARTALVHGVDRKTPTFTVISAWDEQLQEEFPYGHWVGTTDILGLDIYPCARDWDCDYDSIDGAIAQAQRLRLPRYYAVLQAFGDDFYRMPTPAELHEQFRHWGASRMEGYLVFSWDYGDQNLGRTPDVVEQLRRENSALAR